jgi:hypothetical protein
MRTHSEGNANPVTSNHEPVTKDQKQSEADASEAPGQAGSLPCPHSEIVGLYHKILSDCPRVIEWTPARQGYLRSRWLQKAKPNGTTQGYTSPEARPCLVAEVFRVRGRFAVPDRTGERTRRSAAFRGRSRVAAQAVELRQGHRREVPPMNCPIPCDCERFPMQNVVKDPKTGRLEIDVIATGVLCRLRQKNKPQSIPASPLRGGGQPGE